MTKHSLSTLSPLNTEIEIKFAISSTAWSSVSEVLSAGTRASELQSIYFDSDDGALSRAKLSVRLRREGDRWFQSLKAPGSSAVGRFEDEVEVKALPDDPPPVLDLDRHVFGRSRQALRTALGLQTDDSWPQLQARFETRVKRRTRTIQQGTSSIELTIDEGQVVAAGHTRPIRELELELLEGSTADLLEAARHLRACHGLCVDFHAELTHRHR